MSAGNLIDVAVVLAISFGCAMMLPRIWRGWLIEKSLWYQGAWRTRGEVMFAWWPWGDTSRRGAIRGFVATVFAGWAFAIAIVTGDASAYLHKGAAEAARILAFVFLGLFVVGLIIHFSVMLFNRPKFIVPPPQRNEPGVIAERAARRGFEKSAAP